MNETLKILKERRSIRSFRPEPVREEDLNAILEAGIYAPSAKNLQSTKLVVVQDRETTDIPSTARRWQWWCCPTAHIPAGFRMAPLSLGT